MCQSEPTMHTVPSLRTLDAARGSMMKDEVSCSQFLHDVELVLLLVDEPQRFFVTSAQSILFGLLTATVLVLS
jgi:hypothetical protein